MPVKWHSVFRLKNGSNLRVKFFAVNYSRHTRKISLNKCKLLFSLYLLQFYIAFLNFTTKRRFLMNIQPFVCTVERLAYATFDNKMKKNEEPILYVCNATVAEVGRGLAKFKAYHNVLFYLSEEEYKDKVIEKGDRIDIAGTSKWKSSELEYRSYKPSLIKKADKSKLITDDKGKTCYKDTVYAYKIHCKENDWAINAKWYDQNYCTIKESGIKLPLETKKQFENKTLEFYLDKDEYDKLLKYADSVQLLIAYSNKSKYNEKQAQITLSYDEESDVYHLILTAIDEE